MHTHRETLQQEETSLQCLGTVINFHVEYSAVVFLIKISKELSLTISPPEATFTLLIIQVTGIRNNAQASHKISKN